MPGFDGTGPLGMGPMTGGGRGFCVKPARGARTTYRGRGLAGLYGWGYPAMPAQAELEMLRNEVDLLEKELEILEVRLKSKEEQTEK